jgi:hypothetical protein
MNAQFDAGKDHPEFATVRRALMGAAVGLSNGAWPDRTQPRKMNLWWLSD